VKGTIVPIIPADKDQSGGIDLGLKDFAILSTGDKENAPPYFRKYEKQLPMATHRKVVDKKVERIAIW
jgi:transposase